MTSSQSHYETSGGGESAAREFDSTTYDVKPKVFGTYSNSPQPPYHGGATAREGESMEQEGHNRSAHRGGFRQSGRGDFRGQGAGGHEGHGFRSSYSPGHMGHAPPRNYEKRPEGYDRMHESEEGRQWGGNGDANYGYQPHPQERRGPYQGEGGGYSGEYRDGARYREDMGAQWNRGRQGEED